MPEMRFTKHFEENWLARVGNYPTKDTVSAIIHKSMRVQGCREVILDGKPWRVLAIYWHPELDIVIKIDPIDNCCVTVMSRSCWRHDGQQADAADDGDCDPGPAASITEMFLRQQRRAG